MSALRGTILTSFFLLLVGCSGGGTKPKMGTVQGSITVDGAPLATGEIVFTDSTPGRPPVILPINAGKYEGQVPVGKHKIAILSYKESTVPKDQPGEGGVTKTNILPAKYNDSSTETREVSEAGPNNFDFKVTWK